MITIPIEFDSEFGTFRDALVLPDDHGMSDAQIAAIKQARFDQWLSYIVAAADDDTQEIN